MKHLFFLLLIFTFITSCEIFNSTEEPTVDADLEDKVIELKSQQQAWNNLKTSDYKYTFRRSCYCVNAVDVIITVKADTVYSVIGSRPENHSINYDKSRFKTISGFYEELLGYADQKPHKFNVQFNLNGHIPVKAYIDFSKNIIDEEVEFSISNFQD